jgi:hypothetical protein
MPADNSGYEAYVKYLYDRDIARSVAEFRDMEFAPMGPEYAYIIRSLGQLAEADAMLRLTAAIPDIYRTFRAEALARLIREAATGVDVNIGVLNQLGITDVLDSEYRTLAAGMRPEYLPPEEADLLRSFGFTELADSLPGLVYLASARAAESAGRQEEIPLRAQVGNLVEQLAQARSDHERLGEIEEELAALKHAQKENSEQAQRLNDEAKAKKKRPRWWKGLGQIIQGAGVSLADTALVAGPHVIVTAPAALVSWTAGVGILMGGIGDLRVE